MNVSPAILILSVSIGVPLLLLAVGVLYHAYVLGRPQPVEFDDLGAHVEALATESTDALLIDLRDAVEHMQGQLARQRESLSGLLSEGARAPRASMTAPAMTPAMAAPAMAPAMAPNVASPEMRAARPEPGMAAGAFVNNIHAQPETPARGTVSLTASVAELVADGLSDRAIARQLHVGLEEVRMARVRVGR